jgi:hypothetical protein
MGDNQPNSERLKSTSEEGQEGPCQTKRTPNPSLLIYSPSSILPRIPHKNTRKNGA